MGDHCLAAKVNGRIVPLDTTLQSGDQVEILTSKNQTPNPDWEKFVVTHKAKSHIRRWMKEEQRKAVEEGRAIWEKKVKKAKVSISEADLQRFLHDMKVENTGTFFLALRQEKIDPDEVIEMIQEEAQTPAAGGHRGREDRGAVRQVHHHGPRTSPAASSSNGTPGQLRAQLRQVLQPDPRRRDRRVRDRGGGDQDPPAGVQEHPAHDADGEQQDRARWAGRRRASVLFVAGVKMSGDDRPGMLNDITHAISSYLNTNIRSVNIDSHDSMFEGTIILNVQNTDHLNRIVEKIRRIRGVRKAERFEE